MATRNDLALALLRACGIPEDNVRSVEFFQEASSYPEITVTYTITNPDLGHIQEVTQTWELTEEHHRG